MSVGEAVQARLVRSADVLAAACAIATVIAGSQLFAGFGVGALLAAIGGLAGAVWSVDRVHEFGDPAIQVVVEQSPQQPVPQYPQAVPPPPVRGEQTAPIPAVPGGHRPGGPRRGAAVLIGALSLVVVAAVVAVVALQPWRSDATAPSPQAAGPNGKDGFHWALTGEEAGFHVGLWAGQNGAVVFGHWKGFTAYDVETGEELWSWRLPDGNELCAMTRTTASLRGAFTYGDRGPDGDRRCHHLQTISVKTGESVWPEPVSLVDEGFTGRLSPLGTALSISDNLVTAAHAGSDSQDENSTDLIWVDARHGERAGVTDVGAQPVYNGCRLSGYAQAQTYGVLAVANCDDGPRVITWDVDGRDWGPGGELTGCGELSHAMGSALTWYGGDDWLVGCGHTAVEHLHRVDPTGGAHPIDLDGVAVEDIESGALPENLLVDEDDVYLPRGSGSTSDGVSMIPDGRPWGYTVRGASKVRLMAVAERAVTMLVVDPGPATLYTVAGPNEATEGPELPPEVADKLPGAEQAVRIGDYLVCGLSGRTEDDPVIGVVRVGE